MLALTLGALLLAAAPADTTGFTPGGLWFRMRGEGPPVLLLHGANLDSRTLRGLGDSLVASYRVIETDLRFHGQSRDNGGSFAFVADVEEVLNTVGARSAIVIGHSLGATIALDLALAAPARVRALVLMAPAIGGKPATRAPAGFEPVVNALRAGDFLAAGRAMAGTPAMRLFRDSTNRPLLAQALAENTRLFGVDRARVLPAPPAAAGRLGEVTVSILVLAGADDPTESLDHARALQAGIRGARLTVINACGHLLPLDCLSDVVREVRPFLQDVSR